MFRFLKSLLPGFQTYAFPEPKVFNGSNGSNSAAGDSQSWLFPQKPHKDLQVSVILPVKDEALYLGKTLDALKNQTDNTGNPICYSSYEVLLLVNNCTDASFEIAASYHQKHPFFQLYIANIYLPKNKAHIGTVRRTLMDEAYRRLQLNNCNGIIASTDADTEVDSKWLYHIMQEIKKGNDVVGGRIISKPVNKDVRLYYLQDVAYRYFAKKLETKINPCAHDPWPSHFQCYGASMAVKCSAYKNAGGLPVVPFLEDAALCSALYRIDAKIRCSPEVKVYTSSRKSNRVNVGFSAHLKDLDKMSKRKELQYVESPEVLKTKFINKQRLKYYWDNRHTATIDKALLQHVATPLCIPTSWLFKKFNTASYFGELWEETEARMYKSRRWRKMNKHILISDAIQQLRACFNQ